MLRISRLMLALATVAGIQPALGQEMQVLQGGEHFEVLWTGPQRDNLAGGGIGRLTGGGQDRGIAYEPGSLFPGQAAEAVISGGGQDVSITRGRPEAPSAMLAQGAAGRATSRR